METAMRQRILRLFIVMLSVSSGAVLAETEIRPVFTSNLIDYRLDGVFDVVTTPDAYPSVTVGFDRYGPTHKTSERRGALEFPLSEIPRDSCNITAKLIVRVSGYLNPPNGEPSVVQTWRLGLKAGDGHITLGDSEFGKLQSSLEFSGQSQIGKYVEFVIKDEDIRSLVQSEELYASLLLLSLTSVPDKVTNVGLDSARLVVDATRGCSTPETYGGIEFPAGARSFADQVIRYDPNFRNDANIDETQMDARQILGVPEQGEMSTGWGGRVRIKFLDNSLTGSGDSQPDLYIFEVGAPEVTIVDISKDDNTWHRLGTTKGFASGIDIDQFGFGIRDRFSYVRLTHRHEGPIDSSGGADLVAVGARSSGPPVAEPPPVNYMIQAHIGGRSDLIIQSHRLQWHHLKGPAPGLERQFWNPAADARSPTIIDSNFGPNITWLPTGWPFNLGNGTHPESYSSVFKGLTPVLPSDGRCWRLEKLWGDGNTRIVQQPNASNGYALVIRFDDLIIGKRGGLQDMAGSGFYAVRLSRTFKVC